MESTNNFGTSEMMKLLKAKKSREQTTNYECDSCGEKFDDLEDVVSHRQLCAKGCSLKTLIQLAHEAIGRAANAINDLRHGNHHHDSEIQDMTNKLAELAKMVG